MTDGKVAGNGITNGGVGRWQQRFAGSGESTDPGTESSDPGIKSGQQPRLSRKIWRSGESDSRPLPRVRGQWAYGRLARERREVGGASGNVPAHVANGRALLVNDYAASPVQARPPSPVTGAKRAA
jgi:hypothetical protein